ncbi:LysE family transporter [Streptomyces sp. MZ04]|uniref:LysE family transporter n=1 Tax=Streptomyces sp. MZ04 TaxID=2559236 RepID=UPI001ADFF30A|nr:LysE family transporter [Streptomyces sp. MZ04]
MIEALVAGVLAGYGIAMPVGAVGTYLVALTARTSLRTGACAALGIATADGLYALIAMIGGTSLTRVLEPVMDPLRWASAVVLIALAVQGGAKAMRQHRARGAADGAERAPAPIGPARAYLSPVGITLLNPITVVYFAALVLGGRTGTDPDRLEQTAFVLAAFVASASWQLLLAGGGALLGRALTGSRGRLWTALAASAVTGALAVHLLMSG